MASKRFARSEMIKSVFNLSFMIPNDALLLRTEGNIQIDRTFADCMKTNNEGKFEMHILCLDILIHISDSYSSSVV